MIPFEDMPAHSRLWIYQSERELSPAEIAGIRQKADAFVAQWTSHDQLMKASIEVLHGYFVVVCVDERTAPASGCGIDKSMRFVQLLEKEYGLSLTDRMNVAFRKNGKIEACKLPELKVRIGGEKNISIFNNLVQVKEELEKNWETPLENSWQKKFLT